MAAVRSAPASKAPEALPAQHEAPPAAEPPVRPALQGSQLDGSGFPDGVLALTWDDGPDRYTIDLARYLRAEHVSATFFVVRRWEDGVSSDPGFGPAVLHTGYAQIPVLERIIELGHRIGNHTLHHVLLTRASADDARRELAANQRELARFELDELKLFRAPGGAWSNTVAAEENADPEVSGLVGPIRWDIDRKDWQSSVECETSNAADCEAWRGGRRVKASVTAQRYLDAIIAKRHGIVLLHDRVGDVGSRYAFDVARALVPRLIQRGFVFAAPVLAFSPLVERLSAEALRAARAASMQDWKLLDENADGRADLCGRGSSGTVCFASLEAHASASDGSPVTQFGPKLRAASRPEPDVNAQAAACARRLGPTARVADVDGDGAADCCALGNSGLECALARAQGFGVARNWSSGGDFRAPAPDAPGTTELLLGDLNGDGRADACDYRAGAVSCALSTGSSFARATVWARPGLPAAGGQTVLADVNGDGRADLCALYDQHVACGLAP